MTPVYDDIRLLDSPPVMEVPVGEFHACLNARGTYSTDKFVLRLSPEVHRLVDAAVAATRPENGMAPRASLTSEMLYAYSTYIHETVHWWQHVGSTSGLITSLQLPAIVHENQDRLISLIESGCAVKPLKAWAEHRLRNGEMGAALDTANTVVNNAIDSFFFQYLASQPKNILSAVEDRYFESLGHSYWISYVHAVALMASTFDPTFEVLPVATAWEDQFRRVRDQGFDGFVHGGTVRVSPIGMHAIYEGQARFVQLQFLSFALDYPPSLAEWREQGMFEKEYGEAFDAFLAITSATPVEMDDPAIALFMLILDVAINPSRGFPIEIESFEDFVTDADIGIRFLRLCQAARDDPRVLTMITDYSRDQYADVTSILTAACGYDHPLAVLEVVNSWRDHAPILKLLEEKRTFDFDSSNIVVRVMCSHFITFSVDKLDAPEFFCWPGAWMTGKRATEKHLKLFLTHLSLYTDKPDDDGIFPRSVPGISEPNSIKTLTAFYANVVNYDLIRQWIFADGSFNFEYGWLTSKYSNEEMAKSAKDIFKNIFGASPDDFQIL